MTYMKNRLHFSNGNRRERSQVQQEECEKHPETADQDRGIHPSPAIHSPIGREEISVERSHGDNESFEPHTDVYEN
jgi:hypothetical protein